MRFFISYNGDEFYSVDNNGKSERYNGTYYLWTAKYGENELFIRQNTLTGDKCIYKLDLITRGLEIASYVSPQNILLKNNLNLYNGIKFIRLSNYGTEVWYREFSDDIHKLEVWDEQVILGEISDINVHKIFALNVSDGSEIWCQTGGKLQLIKNDVYGVVHTQTTLKIIQYNPTKNKNINDYDITQIVFECFGSLPFFKYTINNHLLYLCFTVEKVILIIDLTDLQVKWLHKVETSADWIDEPRVEGNRLYVLDEKNTLHIFEND